MDVFEEKMFEDGKLYRRKIGASAWHPVKNKRPQKFVHPVAPIDELINEAQKLLNLRTKTETMLRVGANPAMVCRIRKGALEPTAEFILKFYDATGIPIDTIRAIAKIPKLL